MKNVGKDGVVDRGRRNVKETYEDNARQNLGQAEQHEDNRENEQDNLVQYNVRKSGGSMAYWYVYLSTGI